MPFVAGVLAGGVAALGIAINIPFVILSAIVVFVPGLALTVSLTEISAGHLISGSSRLVDAGMLLLKLFFGSIIGALAVGLYSNLFSRITRGPGSILMMQGIILLVPGSRTYMILNHWVSGNEILPGSGGGSQAVMVFIALVAGLLFSNALFPTRKSL